MIEGPVPWLDGRPGPNNLLKKFINLWVCYVKSELNKKGRKQVRIK